MGWLSEGLGLQTLVEASGGPDMQIGHPTWAQRYSAACRQGELQQRAPGEELAPGRQEALQQ